MYNILTPSISINDLDIIQKIMVKDFEYFVDRRALNLSEEDKIFGMMLTSKSGSEWKNIRKILSPTFSSGKLKQMFPLVKQKADEVVKFCEDRIGEKIDFMELLQNYSADVLGSCAFGIEFGAISGKNKDFINVVKKVTVFDKEKLVRAIFVFLLPRIGKLFRIRFTDVEIDVLVKLIEDTMAERRAKNIRRGDFIDILLDACETDEPVGEDSATTGSSRFITI